MRWLFWWRPPCLLRRVLANLKTPTPDVSMAIEGLLWQSRGAWLVIRDPYLRRTGVPRTKLDGEVIIHRDQLEYLQNLQGLEGRD